MKTLKTTILVLLTTVMLFSCGGSASSQPASADGFNEIENTLKGEFGDDAYYTKLAIMYDDNIGNMISATVTKDPESMTMGEWSLSQNTWTQSAEITLEVPEGSKAADFMFQLNDNINLKQLGGLVEKSMKQLTEEKSIENPKLSMAYVKFPDTGDITEAGYNVDLQPENGGTTFHFTYTLEGDLIEIFY